MTKSDDERAWVIRVNLLVGQTVVEASVDGESVKTQTYKPDKADDGSLWMGYWPFGGEGTIPAGKAGHVVEFKMPASTKERNVEVVIGDKKPECWRWPMCCKSDHCPLINATREWLKMGGSRLDTMWPFTTRNDSSTGRFNDYVGIYKGMHQAMDQIGLRREDIFITTKGDHYSLAGYGGGKTMALQALQDLGLTYGDMYMMHNGDNSARGHGVVVTATTETKI